MTKYPTLIPYLTVKDTKQTIKFYETAFGFQWKNKSEVDSSGDIQHVEMIYKDTIIMFAAEGAFGSKALSPKSLNAISPICLYLYCDNTVKIYEQALQAQAPSLTEPEDAFWGDRIVNITDIDGYNWIFATPIKHGG
ncbi:MAG TPA: VOC family protein [Rickettsia endosymbiont of Omalisus fontisbellaquei]|nr:VOC family protein [Rickettsia endosymbiont of Omalisus fontisbellaquei]